MTPVRFPVLLIEGFPTLDDRVISPSSLSVGQLPLPINRRSRSGGVLGPFPIGTIESVHRVHGPEVTRRTGGVFPEGTFVWSATGAVDHPRDVVDLMTTYLVPGSDLRGDVQFVELPDGQVSATMYAATLLGVTLVPARESVWPDVYWEVCPDDQHE